MNADTRMMHTDYYERAGDMLALDQKYEEAERAYRHAQTAIPDPFDFSRFKSIQKKLIAVLEKQVSR